MSVTKNIEVDFFLNGLCFACHMAKNELSDFLQFHSITENNWAEIDKSVNDKVDDLLKKYPDEDHDEIIENYSLDFYQNQEKYPSIHRKALIITIFSFLENELDHLCSIFSESVNCDLRLKDVNGKGVERALIYLSKIAHVDLSKMGKTLPYIKEVNKIRNLIVHNAGVLPDEKSHPINVFVGKQKNISGGPGSTVRFNADFIPELIGILVEFFDELDAEVQRHIQSYQ